MSELPVVVLGHIFGFLSPRRVVLICRLVCGLWSRARAVWPSLELPPLEWQAAKVIGASEASRIVEIKMTCTQEIQGDFSLLLSGLPRLERLSLPHSDEINLLEACPGLQAVRITEQRTALCQNLPEVQVQALRLQKWHFTTRDLQLNHVSQRLHTLELVGCNIEDRDLRILATQLPNLTCLAMTDCGHNLTDSGLLHLTGLRLRVLRVKSQWITDAALASLPRTLRELSFDALHVTDAGIESLRFLDLASLEFYSYFKTTSLHVLDDFAALRSLTIKRRGYSQIIDPTRLLPPLKRLLNLEKLCVFSGTCVAPELRLHHLECDHVTHQQLECIASLKTLSVLRVGNCRELSADSFALFAQLDRLQSLALSWYHCLTDDCLRWLSMQSLESIEFNYCPQFTGTGIRHLQKLPRLFKVMIACCSLCNAGIARICELPWLSALDLQESRTRGNSVTSVGRHILAEWSARRNQFLD